MGGAEGGGGGGGRRTAWGGRRGARLADLGGLGSGIKESSEGGGSRKMSHRSIIRVLIASNIRRNIYLRRIFDAILVNGGNQ